MKQAVTAFLVNSHRKVLAVHRRGEPHNWGLPGGKVDPGEDLVNAVIREVKEETGLTIVSPCKIFVRPCWGEEDYETTCFSGAWDGTIWTPEESAALDEPGVAWVNPRAILYGTFGYYNMALFEHLVTR